VACPDDVTVAAWLGGRIDDTTRVSIESHLDSCAHCRALCADVVRGGRPMPTRLGRFELGACLGRGAMGEVYVAHDPQLGRQVALKLPRTGGDVLHEARMMAQVRHPHVIAVYEAGTAGDIPYVVMEHVEGKDLASIGKLPEAVVVAHIAGVARALAAVHAVGLVHRDVKPANIIVDSDGRARLGDFGLAGIESNGAAADDHALDITRSGALVGTPAYMAPELWEGGCATPATDQFALCVALYELLYGQRPFAGDTLAALTKNVLAGKLREPAKGGRLAGVVRRGLARDPAARWPSLSALADALEPRARSGRSVIAAGVLITAAAAFVHVTSRPAATDPCGGAARELAGVWDASKQAQLASTFGASKLPFAATSSVRISGTLDRYATAWSAAQREACVANRVRHVESDSLFDRRAACLADRKRQLAAFVNALAQPSAEIVERASAAAVALPSPAACVAHETRSLDDAPADPIRAAAFGDKLAAAKVQFELGDYKGALVATEPLVAEVATIGPRRASELHSLRALVQTRAGDDTAGEASFRAALDAAARAGDDERIVRAWAALINMLGSKPGKSDQALALVETAKVALVRAGSTPELEAALAVNVGSAQRRAGNLAAAHAELTHALALKEQVFGVDAVDNVIAMTNLANVLNDQGSSKEALALHERVVAIHTRTHGAEHPLAAQARSNVGAILEGMGEHERAAAETRAALAVLEPVWGADNRRVLLLRNNLGVALGNADRLDEARAVFKATLGAAAKAPQEVADALAGLAKLEIRAKRPDQAIEMLEKCLALRTKLVPADHPDLGVTMTNLGDALAAAQRCKDANVQFEHAIAVYAAKLPPDHRLVGYALAGQANCLTKLGDRAGAKAALVRARAIAEKSQDPKLRHAVGLTMKP
jgi:tetratricopeptide (TPR) repeat protein